MNRVSAVAAALALTVCTATATSAQQRAVLVSTAWLAEHLGDDNLVILHVGSEASYAAAHVPGARVLPLGRFAPERAGLSTELPELSALRDALEEVGITNESRIVIYGATHPQTLAARLWVTLQHVGLGANAMLLDGGLRAWQVEQRAVSTEPSTTARGSVQLRPSGSVFVDHAFVQQQLDAQRMAIVDARDEPFWSGTQHNRQRAARPGRIPGARNIPYSSLVDSSGRLLERAALQAAFERAGVTHGQPIVTYCHVGQQASLLFVAARLLGHEVRLYDGSFEDWSRRPELRVETSAR